MEKVIVAVITAVLFSIFSIKAQDTQVSWGTKAGVNSSTFRDQLEKEGGNSIDYQLNTGFFVGGLANIQLTEKLNLQPELLFSYRNIGVEIDGFNINDPYVVLDYKGVRKDYFLELPVMLRYDLFPKVYTEAGLQLGYLLHQKEDVKQSPYGTQDFEFEDYDRFDAGISAGLGLRLSAKLNLTGRYFYGLVERDNSVSSSAIYGGLEYKI